ncbi:hypothetical protein HBB16_19055 [Pseudonocardia sp. MCCB 268]|nr:hypothetical protein [Pseudonocardia cytotoxica]
MFVDDGSGSIRDGEGSHAEESDRRCSHGSEAADVDWRDVALFSHGTTIATNALITRRFLRDRGRRRGFPRRHRDPARNHHPVGHLRRDGAAVRGPPAPADRVRAGRSGNVVTPLDEGPGPRRGGSCAGGGSGRGVLRTRSRTRRIEVRLAEISPRSCLGSASRPRYAAGDLRVRAVLHHGTRRRRSSSRTASQF